MPCSCGNTTCSCGIPCYCSKESCKCHDCAIALPRLCEICNKPLISERRTDEDTCSCFLGESTALILENQENPKRKLGNIPMPIGYFVSGKLMVNFMIPIPVLRFPYFIPQHPFCLMPQVPSIEENHSKISFISDKDVLKPLYPPENSDFPSTEELHQSLSKSNGQSSDYDSSGYSSNCEQNAEMFCQKFRPPSEFLQSTDYRQTVNISQNAKSEAEDHANIQEMTSFYLPSVKINNISYPVGLMDPIWRLPNPAVCIAGSPDSTLNILNPFYATGPVHTTQTVATYKNEFSLPVPSAIFEANGMQYPTDRNVQADCAISLQMNKETLDPLNTSEQPNLEMNDENLEFTVSSNNATENECAAIPFAGNFNASALSEQCGISANCLMPDQSQSLCVTSTSTSGKNYALRSCSDICNPANRISGNVYPESTFEPWQKVDWCSPLPEIPVLTGSNPHILKENLRTFQTSRLETLRNSNRIPNSEENESLQKGNPSFVSANDEENIPFYVDPCTTQKMEKFLKPTRNLNVSSPKLFESVL